MHALMKILSRHYNTSYQAATSISRMAAAMKLFIYMRAEYISLRLQVQRAAMHTMGC